MICPRELISVCFFLVCLWWSCGCVLAQDSPATITPHPKTQALLAEFYDVLHANVVQHRFNQPDIATGDIWRRFISLKRLAEEDPSRFIQQAILADATHDYGGGLFDTHVVLDFVGAHTSFIVGLSKLLYCDDLALRREAWRYFPRVVSCEYVEYAPAYTRIRGVRDYVTGDYQVPEVATPLKRAIFERMPQAAFLMFASTVSRRSGESYRRFERTVDNALYQKRWLGGIPDGKIDEETATALRMLGHDAHWWARMYAAETMVQNKEFRDDDLIARLKDDEHELVRGSIASLTTPDPFRAAEVDK